MTRFDSPLLSRYSSQSLLTSSQIALDGFSESFSKNLTNPMMLLPMMAGTLTFQASRALLASVGMGRLFSSVGAWIAEVGVFHESNRLAACLAGNSPSQTHFLRTAMDLGVFKLTGSVLPRSNFVIRNASQALAMLGSEELAVTVNLLERSSESFSSRYAYAFASSVQMEVGALLSTTLTGGSLNRLGRGLEFFAELNSTRTSPSRSRLGQRLSFMSADGYDIWSDTRDIPEELRINYKRFREGVEGLKRYARRMSETPVGNERSIGEDLGATPRDSLIPVVPRENEARELFLTRFLGFAKWRGDDVYSRAQTAVQNFNSLDVEVSQRGRVEILQIAQTILNYIRPTPRIIIGVTGKDASGKDSVLEMLARQGFRTMSLSDALRAQLVKEGRDPSRENCRTLANELRARDGASALARLAISQMEPGINYAFGSIRNPAEVEALREAGEGHFHFIATTAPAEIRFKRLKSRGRLGDAPTLEAFLAHEALEASNPDPNAQQMDRVIAMADHQVDNSSSREQFERNVWSVVREFLDLGTN